MIVKISPEEFNNAFNKAMEAAVSDNLMQEPTIEETEKLQSIFYDFLEYLNIDAYDD